MTTPNATTETHTTSAEACRVVAAEVRALSTTHTEAIGDAAKLIEAIGETVGLGAGRELANVAKTLREVAAYTAEGQDSIASALDDLAADLDTPREQLLVNLSAAVELLTPAEDARLKALATVQALHADGMISDTAAAALNQALETPDAVEGT